MSIYELEGVPKNYSIQAQEVQRGREARIQHLLQHVSKLSTFIISKALVKILI